MTSIIVLRLKKGEQILVLADTKHIYGEGENKSVKKETKAKKINDLLLFGAGYDDSIGQICREIKEFSDIDSCSEKIKSVKEANKEHTKYEATKSAGENVINAEFFVLDPKEARGNIIRNIHIAEIKDFDIIGSGAKRIGDIQDIFRGYKQKEFNSSTMAAFFKDAISAFLNISKFDDATGHPTVFPLEIYLLEKDKPIKEFVLEFDSNLLESLESYKIGEIKND